MTPWLEHLLAAIGRRLVRWGQWLAHRADAAARSAAGQPPQPEPQAMADRRSQAWAAWEARVASIPMAAWQGHGGAPAGLPPTARRPPRSRIAAPVPALRPPAPRVAPIQRMTPVHRPPLSAPPAAPAAVGLVAWPQAPQAARRSAVVGVAAVDETVDDVRPAAAEPAASLPAAAHAAPIPTRLGTAGRTLAALAPAWLARRGPAPQLQSPTPRRDEDRSPEPRPPADRFDAATHDAPTRRAPAAATVQADPALPMPPHPLQETVAPARDGLVGAVGAFGIVGAVGPAGRRSPAPPRRATAVATPVPAARRRTIAAGEAAHAAVHAAMHDAMQTPARETPRPARWSPPVRQRADAAPAGAHPWPELAPWPPAAAAPGLSARACAARLRRLESEQEG